jgi:flagellar motor switch protein FliN/FliY
MIADEDTTMTAEAEVPTTDGVNAAEEVSDDATADDTAEEAATEATGSEPSQEVTNEARDSDTARTETQDQQRESVQKADFQPLSNNPSEDSKAELDILYDVNLPVAVELGRTAMTIREMLGVCHGSVIALQREAGEPVDILASGKLIGRGEVVVVDGKFGVRVTELISRLDGIEKS